jgi:hypothetical protein
MLRRFFRNIFHPPGKVRCWGIAKSPKGNWFPKRYWHGERDRKDGLGLTKQQAVSDAARANMEGR